MAKATNGRSSMTNKPSRTGTANDRRIIEHGIQPAQMQHHPALRPATAQIQAPPAPAPKSG